MIILDQRRTDLHTGITFNTVKITASDVSFPGLLEHVCQKTLVIVLVQEQIVLRTRFILNQSFIEGRLDMV